MLLTACSDQFAFLNALNKPCPGDPLHNITITPTPISGKHGGLYGCARQGEGNCRDGIYNKWHDGIDLTAKKGTPVHSMYSGTVVNTRKSFSPGQYKANSFGNFVAIRSQLPGGNVITMKFNHLDIVFLSNGRRVNIGDVIGLSGNTGNAAADDVIPHLHLQAINQQGDTQDPSSFLATQINGNGRVIKKCAP